MNGNVVVACSLLYVFPFFVLCFTKGEGQHSVYGESVGCELVCSLVHCLSISVQLAIWFNKTCKIKQLTPTYMSIKINGNNRQDRSTLRMATTHRLNQEIKTFMMGQLDTN